MLIRRRRAVRRGDTIIEVSFAIAIFAMVSLIAITLMNNGVTMAEGIMENTMARNEIDAQAEALRFIQMSYLSEKELTTHTYEGIWKRITARAIDPSDSTIGRLPADLVVNGQPANCAVAYTGATNIFALKNSFIVNTRKIDPSNNGQSTIIYADRNTFTQAALHPRVIFKNSSGQTQENEMYENNTANQNNTSTNYYNQFARAEGIWVMAVKEKAGNNPEFYDFHIRTCWYGPGRDTPTTIATIIRLYNPDYTAY